MRLDDYLVMKSFSYRIQEQPGPTFINSTYFTIYISENTAPKLTQFLVIFLCLIHVEELYDPMG